MAMNWKGPEALKKIQNESVQRLEGACMFIRGKARQNISRAQPTRLYHHRAAEDGTKGTSYRVGLSPSQPGEYPKKVSGRLRLSVTYEVNDVTMEARVGTNIPYGKMLELGTPRMLARPWLLPTIIFNNVALVRHFGIGRPV